MIDIPNRIMSLEELQNTLSAPLRIIEKHLEAIKANGVRPIQMPQVVTPVPPVVRPVQPNITPAINNTPLIPPTKGGCGCWGK